jgi:hypothetical protein
VLDLVGNIKNKKLLNGKVEEQKYLNSPINAEFCF